VNQHILLDRFSALRFFIGTPGTAEQTHYRLDAHAMAMPAAL
jgi:hypothetical protein